MYQKPDLSAWEYVTFSAALCRAVVSLIINSVSAGFRGTNGASTYKHHVVYSTMRTFATSVTIRHGQAFTASTSEAYRVWSAKNGHTAEIVDIGDNTVGCWIGNKNAEVVVIWFHGGGYVLMGIAEHMDLMASIILKAGDRGTTVAAFVLQYDVAPQATYPRQLTQAALALRYLTENSSISPSQLVIGGDSAGGNLALALISHIMHPHSQVPIVTLKSQMLRGICLISPWLTFAQTAPSFHRNAKKDILTRKVLETWSRAFMGSATQDNYNTPLNASPGWWADLPAHRILVMAGADEVFVDDILLFAAKIMEQNRSKTEVFVAKGEAHDAPITESIIGDKVGKQKKRLYSWMLDCNQK